jgi:deoxyribodipyrimidine photo-lyase
MAAISTSRSAAVGRTALVLFRATDLRLHDHSPLTLAHSQFDRVVHAFCFDDAHVGPAARVDFSRSLPETGFLKTGVFRAQFLLEAVADLRASLVARRRALVVRAGSTREVVPALVRQHGVHTVFVHEGEAPEERDQLGALQAALKKVGCELNTTWGNTLYHIDDLPFDPRQQQGAFPPTATNFRTKTEKNSTVRPALPVPRTLKPAPGSSDADVAGHGDIPTLAALVGADVAATHKRDARGVFPFVGGETAALARLQDYFFDQNCLKDYFHTRNGMLGANYSSKFSPYLSMGCLSPRRVAQEVQRYEESRVKNKDTYWMLFELNVRDYFRYYTLYWGSSVFHLHGPKGKRKVQAAGGKHWTQDMQLFERWRTGTTGNPMIDANMRELMATGFMSNRGRQIVASYLTRDLGIDWRLGAMHFESLLIDHDPCSNWGNWTYGAGVGSDPREDRYFSVPKQTSNYDKEHKYIRHWVQEMEHCSKQQLVRQLTRGCRPKPKFSKSGKGGGGGGGGGGRDSGSSGGKRGKNKGKGGRKNRNKHGFQQGH